MICCILLFQLFPQGYFLYFDLKVLSMNLIRISITEQLGIWLRRVSTSFTTGSMIVPGTPWVVLLEVREKFHIAKCLFHMLFFI